MVWIIQGHSSKQRGMFYSCLAFGICHFILRASLPLHQSDCLGTSLQCHPIIFPWAFYQFKCFYLAQNILSKCPLTNLNKWRRLVVSAIERIITAADTRMEQNEAEWSGSSWLFLILYYCLTWHQSGPVSRQLKVTLEPHNSVCLWNWKVSKWPKDTVTLWIQSFSLGT